MEKNSLEIKRFLNDYKIFIIVGSIIFAISFAVFTGVIDSQQEEPAQEAQEDFNPSSEEILNDAQPAYFQLYIEYEDGRTFTNSSIINQYFNLSSVKEEVQQETGVDIESVEEEIYLNDLSDEIDIINVSKNGTNHLITASFNLGNEQENIMIAEYYYNDILFNEDSAFFEGKTPFVFVEPKISERTETTDESSNDVSEETVSPESNIGSHIINTLVGFIVGIAIMIGLALLKVLFGKKLTYSFTYEIDENEKFILYDKNLQNEENLSQFVAIPFGRRKIVVSEQKMGETSKDLLSGNKDVGFNQKREPKIALTGKHSLADINATADISEILIIIHPSKTTRKWYNIQKQFTGIYGVPVKIIQINE